MKWSNASPLPWSSIATQWNTAAKAESVTLAGEASGSVTEARVVKAESITFTANAGQTLAHGALYPASAAFAVTASQASVGGFVFADSISFAAEAGYTQSDDATLANSISFALTADGVTNINHQESITAAVNAGMIPGQFYADSISFAAIANMTVVDGFLWSPVADEATTWTKVEYPTN
tara:strand:+ start:6186 stop:6722 length:537 start_codon:yes stop_codon:yes gene_type:complete